MAPHPASATLWLHATTGELAEPLKILADEIEALRDAPNCRVTWPDDCPFSLGDGARLEEELKRENVVGCVFAGDALPARAIERIQALGLFCCLIEARLPQPKNTVWFRQRQARKLLAGFDQIHAVDRSAADVLKRLLPRTDIVRETGQLARFGPIPPCNVLELDALKEMIDARPVWFAHSVLASEAEAMLLAHVHALRRSHRLLLILQPRDPACGTEVAERARDIGLTTARRSLDDEIEEMTQVYIADEEDDPGLFLRLAPVSVLGGSLTLGSPTPSPLLPAALGSALIFGPHASADRQGLLEQLRRAGGARQVEGASLLGDAVSAFVSPEAGAEAALKAWTFASAGAEVTAVLAEHLRDTIALQRGGS